MIKLVSKARQLIARYDSLLARLGLSAYVCPCANIGEAVKDKKVDKQASDKESHSSSS
ncbi:hypothetical protein [Celerinatantimonas sp. MCCC 1A17872]|uniref:hypothetical protein n=1 Tax=Celerinatantimonas sp. MCCC 1A17872 TaxID=3177514 RepID=UPI0038BF937A